MTNEIKISDRQIVIKGFSDHIDIDVKGYAHYLQAILELQQAIEIVKATVIEKSKSNIVIPGMVPRDS